MRTRRLMVFVAILASIALLSVQAPVNAAETTPDGGFNVYKTEPAITPPVLDITTPAADTADGYLMGASIQTPAGTNSGYFIWDDSGELVWGRPSAAPYTVATDLKVVDWLGQPALGYHEGIWSFLGASQGRVKILDTGYNELATLEPANGYGADLHDFIITPNHTIIFIIYTRLTMDLTDEGGPADAEVWNGVLQEMDIATGDVIFEWSALDHVPFSESILSVNDPLIDFVHLNSVELDANGDFITSARNTDTVYKIDRASGNIAWRLGGVSSDFTFTDGDPGIQTQHDARLLPGGRIGIFDNGDTGRREVSRYVIYQLDETNWTATPVLDQHHDPDVWARATGNAQQLPNGNYLVYYGSTTQFTEYDAAGNVELDGRFAAAASYRMVRHPWVGTPSQPPKATIIQGVGATTVYASWNGSTETAAWRIDAGPDAGNLSELATVPRSGFETDAAFNTRACWFSVTPLDAYGTALSTPVDVNGCTSAIRNLLFLIILLLLFFGRGGT